MNKQGIIKELKDIILLAEAEDRPYREPPAPILKPTPEQLKAIDMVLDGDAPTECREYDLIWCPTDKLSPTDMLTMSKGGELSFRGKLRWHLKDAPPAPDDINKGVWFRDRLMRIWDEIPSIDTDAVMVAGVEFVREGVPDGFCRQSCAYFALVRRLAKHFNSLTSEYLSLEWTSIKDEAERLFPKAKGE